MAKEHNYVSLASRLSVYSLADRESQLVPIKLQPNETLALTPDDSDLSTHIVRLRPESPADLKKWIGIPNESFHSSRTARGIKDEPTRRVAQNRIFTPHPSIYPESPELQDHLFNFLFSNSAGVSEDQLQVLHRFITRAKISISIFLFADIFVARGARLVVDAKAQILFARYITIEHTGIIEMQSPFSKIDCAGMRTVSRLYIPKVGDPGFGPVANL